MGSGTGRSKSTLIPASPYRRPWLFCLSSLTSKRHTFEKHVGDITSGKSAEVEISGFHRKKFSGKPAINNFFNDFFFVDQHLRRLPQSFVACEKPFVQGTVNFLVQRSQTSESPFNTHNFRPKRIRANSIEQRFSTSFRLWLFVMCFHRPRGAGAM